LENAKNLMTKFSKGEKESKVQASATVAKGDLSSEKGDKKNVGIDVARQGERVIGEEKALIED